MQQTKEELWAVAAEYFRLKSEGKNPIAEYYIIDRKEWYAHGHCFGLDIPNFNDGDIWRLKPETIQHRGGEYPKPCTGADELMDSLHAYIPGFEINDDGVFPVANRVSIPNRRAEVNAAKSGLYYLKGKDALERAKVIYEIY